jgi:transaldolase/glucose-6-phosphate isomerase
MSMSRSGNAIQQANAHGQSIWLDSISRDMIKSGELARQVSLGVSGVTSNPTIFEKAVSEGASYDTALMQFASSGGDVRRVFEGLAVDDIRDAADVLRPVYDRTSGRDGYVSIEVSPTLARDTAGTVEEARRLYGSIGRPNVMIKVPGTAEGMPAVRSLIGEGINVNVTLLFSIAMYRQAAQAYMAGLRDYRAGGGADVSRVASVASFFVSRVDTSADKLLEKPPQQAARVDPQSLKGKTGIANAKLAYADFQGMFGGATFGDLRRAGAQVQRPLWASTSTKNPDYLDTMYLDGLIGRDTVNTVPPATLVAFLEHGNVTESVTRDVDAARDQVQKLRALGISLDAITDQLLAAGLQAFSESYDKLLKQIESKLAKMRPVTLPRPAARSSFGGHSGTVDSELARLVKDRVAERVWARDESVWPEPSPGGARAKDRLGWLGLPETMEERAREAAAFAGEMQGKARSIAWLGMGGSGLGAAVIAGLPHEDRSDINLRVIDTTTPDDLIRFAAERGFDLAVVASKSGTTAEPLAIEQWLRQPGVAPARNGTPRSYVAITDPGTPLARRSRDFRRVFLAPADVGGRFSVLSEFGMVAAGLQGRSAARMAEFARFMAAQCREPGDQNPGLRLGASLASLARRGMDKVTIMTSPALEGFGLWVEQLIAESTGKNGKGLVPVSGEMPYPVEMYGEDRQFVYMRLATETLRDDRGWERTVAALEAAGRPVTRIEVPEPAAVAGEFFRWEFAVCAASNSLGVYPLDEPDVASAKVNTDRALKRGWADAVPDIASSDPVEGGSSRNPTPHALHRAVETLLGQRRPGDYLAIAAYLPETEGTTRSLNGLREAITGRTGMATMLGYGPRYLHSTGQLHKGGPDSALVLVLTYAPRSTPSAELTRLWRAQAAGDVLALRQRGRRVVFVELATADASEATQLITRYKI